MGEYKLFKGVVKSKEEILKWFEKNGYILSPQGTWYKDNEIGFLQLMFKFCGKEICFREIGEDYIRSLDGWDWNRDWIVKDSVKDYD